MIKLSSVHRLNYVEFPNVFTHTNYHRTRTKHRSQPYLTCGTMVSVVDVYMNNNSLIPIAPLPLQHRGSCGNPGLGIRIWKTKPISIDQIICCDHTHQEYSNGTTPKKGNKKACWFVCLISDHTYYIYIWYMYKLQNRMVKTFVFWLSATLGCDDDWWSRTSRKRPPKLGLSRPHPKENEIMIGEMI